MNSSLGIVLEQHPLLLSIKASWLGVCSSIRLQDLVSDGIEKIKFSSPFCPPLQRGSPRAFSLQTSIRKEEKYTTDSVLSTELTMTIRFADIDSDGRDYLERDFIIRSSTSISKNNDNIKCSNMSSFPITNGCTLKLQIMNDDSNITTNIAFIEVARGCYNLHSSYYVYRMYQQENSTVITIIQLTTNKRLIFTMKREHIDRSVRIRRVIDVCNHIIENHPTLSSYLLSRQVDANNDDGGGAAATAAVNKRFDIVYQKGKKTFATSISRQDVAMMMMTVQLSELKSGCVIGSCFENYIATHHHHMQIQ